MSKYGVFSGPCFPTFGLSRERYVSLRILSECGKIRTRKTPYLDTFHAVINSFSVKTLKDISTAQTSFSCQFVTDFVPIPKWLSFSSQINFIPLEILSSRETLSIASEDVSIFPCFDYLTSNFRPISRGKSRSADVKHCVLLLYLKILQGHHDKPAKHKVKCHYF